MTKTTTIFILFVFLHSTTSAQDKTIRPQFAVETRLTTYLQSGFDVAAFYYPSKTRFSFGAIFATHNIGGNAKELVFNSNNHDELSIRLSWLAGIVARYHLTESRQGFFGEIGMGLEEFKVASGDQSHHNPNGFISPAVGFMWFPGKNIGLYILPKVTANLIVCRDGEKLLMETNYQLKPVFPAPSLAIGWKF